METGASYIPTDRRLALARGKSLPEHTYGTALFADISGFTPLTEALVRDLGPRRGPEELTHHLNLVYNALIAELDRYGGSVIGFAGDAITCWFDQAFEHSNITLIEQPGLWPEQAQVAARSLTALRAATCALALQRAMQQFVAVTLRSGTTVALQMKISLATGSVGRFVVGDPQIQLLDVIAGATLDTLAAGEHQAEKGEIILDAATSVSLARLAQIQEWRVDSAGGGRFGVLAALRVELQPTPWPAQNAAALNAEQLRPWLLTPVYTQIQAGQGEFLAELRPGVALFLRFLGLDYDTDPQVSGNLDGYIRCVQNILARYDGALMHVTMGDKGSYLSAVFGAPIAHEDEAIRAASAALELRALSAAQPFINSFQIGVSHGRMRTGAYGGASRRTYGIHGDDVNLAARLMQAAQPGQILVSQNMRRLCDNLFTWGPSHRITVKGKAASIEVFGLLDAAHQRTVHVCEPRYGLMMIGRTKELAQAEERIALALRGRGQVLGIGGTAGVGKSRLGAEIVRIAGEHGMTVYGGACQSYGTRSSYLVWHEIWRAFFGLDAAQPPVDQVAGLTRALAAIDPQLASRAPLLGPVLNLPISDNDLVAALDPQLRSELLHATLLECLRRRARQGSNPTLLVLEDSHWIDQLSRELLEYIGRNLHDLPVLMLILYRPPHDSPGPLAWGHQARNITEIALAELDDSDLGQLIAQKFGQLFGTDEVPTALAARVVAKAQGNPFYAEEIINYLYDRGIAPADLAALATLELPDNLHSLILSRIDRLSEGEKTTIKVASVVGRLFKASWLWGSYPQIGDPQTVKGYLQQLSLLDLTPLDKPEPELEYLFKHITTQEVIYESIPFAMRESLHEAIGTFIEEHYPIDLGKYLDVLAHHYGHSRNQEKQRVYFRRAGDAAKFAYANEAAIGYYQRLLPLLEERQHAEVLYALGEIWQLIGRWPEAENTLRQAMAMAEQVGQASIVASAQNALGDLLSRTQSYNDAQSWLEQALLKFEQVDNQTGLSRALQNLSFVHVQLGEHEQALHYSQRQLAIASQLGDLIGVSTALNNIGLVYFDQSKLEQARDYLQRALDTALAAGYRKGAVLSGGDLAGVYWQLGDYHAALSCLQQALTLAVEIGYLQASGLIIGNAGLIYTQVGDYQRALACYNYGLRVAIELGDWPNILLFIGNMPNVLVEQGNYSEADQLYNHAVALGRKLNIPYILCENRYQQADLFARQGRINEAHIANLEALEIATQIQSRDVELLCQILDVRLHLLFGTIDAAAAVYALENLLAEHSEESEQAELRYAIWRIDPTLERNKQLVIALYHKLYERTSRAEYRRRYQELSGEVLPQPPPLPDLSLVTTSTAIDLGVVLAHIEAHLAADDR